MHRKDGRPCSGGEERSAGGRKVRRRPSAVVPKCCGRSVRDCATLTCTHGGGGTVTYLRQRSAVRVDDRLADVRPDLTEGTLYSSTQCNAMPEAALLQCCEQHMCAFVRVGENA
jgi:hypothetical protein